MVTKTTENFGGPQERGYRSEQRVTLVSGIRVRAGLLGLQERLGEPQKASLVVQMPELSGDTVFLRSGIFSIPFFSAFLARYTYTHLCRGRSSSIKFCYGSCILSLFQFMSPAYCQLSGIARAVQHC